MNLRSITTLSAILLGSLAKTEGNAQDILLAPQLFPPAQHSPPEYEYLRRLPPLPLTKAPATSQALWISNDANRDPLEDPPVVSQVDWVAQPGPTETPSDPSNDSNAARFSGDFLSGSSSFGVGVDFYSAPDFEGGLIVFGRDVAMKIGGYVKADFIYDFNPMDSTDSFDTTDIPIGAPQRTNVRFHSRQTRLSFDTRWASNHRTIKIYVEGDFFSEGNQFRLRHGYGELGSLLVGQTWTTFTDVAAAPSTLDFEGSVSSVNRRQALARWTQPVCHDLTMALAVEDTRFNIETPVGITADARSPSPDFVGNVRLERDWAQIQFAGLYRIVGAQPTGGTVVTTPAWGLNFTGVVLLTPSSKAYYQILFGDGIGSYRGLPDAAPSAADASSLLPLFGWMVGITRQWNKRLSSNFTYAENSLENTGFQSATDVHRTTYLAMNLIYSPLDRVRVGVEYLYGLRENVDGAIGAANRIQAAFIFDLP